MTSVDLSSMSPKQLLKIQADAAAALATKADSVQTASATITEFAEDLKRLAEKWTAKAAALVPAPAKIVAAAANGNGAKPATRRVAKVAKPVIKFRDKDGHSWSGRGKQPGWLKTAVAGGRSIEDFRVAA